jgi:CRISPR-associated protein Csd1
MSYLLQLYKTYQANLSKVGVFEKKNNQLYTLLPISHTTQTAHIEVLVSEEGDFLNAEILGKKGEITVIPCTEGSASRSGLKTAPYPLHDKLCYVAGDLVAYGGKVKDKNKEPFTYYLDQLYEWANSPYAYWKVKSIYQYVQKRTLISDLVKAGILFVDEDNVLINKWDNKRGEKPRIYQVVTGNIDSAFIRFNVRSQSMSNVWRDQEMYQSFIDFYNQHLHDKDYCYVTGQQLPVTYRHANKIRNAADKAKLISSNDDVGFTFRGRFTKAEQAAQISYDVSQKAHNALKWLIQRQGKIVGERVFLVWGYHVQPIPDPIGDMYDTEFGLEITREDQSSTYDWYAKEVAKAIDGKKNELSSEPVVNILVLDAATDGRMAVLYYRSLKRDDYLERLKEWHTTCIWRHRYSGGYYFSTPATRDIAYAAYGLHANDKLVKGLIKRMLPCIVDGQKIPLDIVRSVFYRASNPASFEDEWQWEKTLHIACALINKYQGGINVELDSTDHDRSYLFGRLLAIADVFERSVIGKEEKRSTNAIRYMQTFSMHPSRTWKIIREALIPYEVRWGTDATYFVRLMDEVTKMFQPGDFESNAPLQMTYLAGLSCQRQELYKKREK